MLTLALVSWLAMPCSDVCLRMELSCDCLFSSSLTKGANRNENEMEDERDISLI